MDKTDGPESIKQILSKRQKSASPRAKYRPALGWGFKLGLVVGALLIIILVLR